MVYLRQADLVPILFANDDKRGNVRFQFLPLISVMLTKCIVFSRLRKAVSRCAHARPGLRASNGFLIHNAAAPVASPLPTRWLRPFPGQRSGTIVTARPDEQLAPNSPSFSRLALYIAARGASVARFTYRCLRPDRWFERFQDGDTWATTPFFRSGF